MSSGPQAGCAAKRCGRGAVATTEIAALNADVDAERVRAWARAYRHFGGGQV